jgi:hypothetical protein
MWIGSQHPETPFVEIGQFATFFYFSWFLIIVPIIGLIENSMLGLISSLSRENNNLYNFGEFMISSKKNLSFSELKKNFSFSELKKKTSFSELRDYLAIIHLKLLRGNISKFILALPIISFFLTFDTDTSYMSTPQDVSTGEIVNKLSDILTEGEVKDKVEQVSKSIYSSYEIKTQNRELSNEQLDQHQENRENFTTAVNDICTSIGDNPELNNLNAKLIDASVNITESNSPISWDSDNVEANINVNSLMSNSNLESTVEVRVIRKDHEITTQNDD